jgi:hypothetical protein
VACRDSAPGGLLPHPAETEGIPISFEEDFEKNKNVYMFRYLTEAGHHNNIHPDHGATTQELVHNNVL